MKLNPDTLSILKEWKEDETINHSSDDFIQIEPKDWETVEYFATKKYATKSSKDWFYQLDKPRFRADGTHETWKDFYQNHFFGLVGQLVSHCCFRRKDIWSGGIRQEIKDAVHTAFNYQFFEDFRDLVFMPFVERHRAWSHLEHKAKPEYEEKTQILKDWDFSTLERFLGESL